MSPEQIAEAFSRHRFVETYDSLAADVRWQPIGGTVLEGRDAVIAACTESADYLAGVTTEFRSFRTIVASDVVVVDSLASFVDADGETSVVASCDIYDFADGMVTMITSYAVEIEPA